MSSWALASYIKRLNTLVSSPKASMQSLAFLIVLYVALAHAKANDWAHPCFDGECAYDLAGTAESGYGSIKLFSSPSAIADITPAAGWVVLSCDQQAFSQEIRLVCKSHNAEGCENLLAGGAANKIVRLPESCSPAPFARVNFLSVDHNQGIPEHLHHQVARRNGVPPEVHVLSIDTNWDAVDTSQHGEVSFIFSGGNVPAFSLDNSVTAIEHWDPYEHINNAINDIANWNFDRKVGPASVDFQKNLQLLDIHQQCGPAAASLELGVNARAHAQVVVGVSGSGSFLKINKIAGYANLDADFEAHVLAKATLNGQVDSGRKLIFTKDIPAFSVPAIFKLGAVVQVDGETKAQLDMSVDADIGVAYQLQGVQFRFPATPGSPPPKISPKDTPIKLAASAGVKATGTIEGRLYPMVKLSLNALGGKAKAEASIQAEAWAKLDFNADASANAQISTKGKRSTKAVARAYIPPYDLLAREVQVQDHTNSDAATFSGCASLVGGIGIDGRVQGNFFHFFDANKQVSIFHKDFAIFKKCWNGGKAKRFVSEVTSRRSLLEGRAANAAICPKSPRSVTPIDSETVKASDIH
ncbi:hypothetical protein HGRIS_010160 [Hohenbuehelia grisea]|uniref:Uncharacterized protein n=1 Tax=Hohenbuehelia grisea TaxID=104357 RepID=A0ABR3J3F7_9AGAR